MGYNGVQWGTIRKKGKVEDCKEVEKECEEVKEECAEVEAL
jgi:hypothetical protein